MYKKPALNKVTSDGGFLRTVDFNKKEINLNANYDSGKTLLLNLTETAVDEYGDKIEIERRLTRKQAKLIGECLINFANTGLLDQEVK